MAGWLGGWEEEVVEREKERERAARPLLLLRTEQAFAYTSSTHTDTNITRSELTSSP